MVAEKRLLMSAYTEMHQAHTSIPIESQLMNREFIMSLAPLQQQELSYSYPQEMDKPLKDTLMPKCLESLYDYLFNVWE